MKKSSTRRDRADQTRERILASAVHHFGLYGLAGARTGSIAQSANVNKALLYYYFKDKQALYAAALEAVSGTIVENAIAALESGATPGECLLRCVLNHFDRILTQGEFQRLFRQEMVRVRLGGEGGEELLPATRFGPLLARTRQTVRAGIRCGELRKVDWLQFVYTALGGNVFYFLSAPLMRVALSFEPFSPDRLAARRKSAIFFLANTLFTDSAHGVGLARRVLSSMPMPAIEQPPESILRFGPPGQPAPVVERSSARCL